MSMRGILVAAGPAFKVGVTVPAFENVHLRDAMAWVLGLSQAPNDGNAAIGQALLR